MAQDVIRLLIQDHREVEELFVRLEELNGTASDEAKTVAEQAVMELVRHAVAEEQYVYPAVREYVPGGDAIADEEIAEHSTAERTMKQLESLEPDDPQFWPTAMSLVTDIREHIRGEEGTLFPSLRVAAPPEKLEELGAKVERAKAMAPTRPHPAAPDRPPANKLLAPGAGLVDRVRDVLTGRGRGD